MAVAGLAVVVTVARRVAVGVAAQVRPEERSVGTRVDGE